jgi:hypothetical protein
LTAGNIVAEYLQVARNEGPEVEAGFCAVLTDMVGLICTGTVPTAKKLSIGQNEVSALLSGNIVRFSLEKLIRIARRAGLRLFLDMGDTADGSHATTRGRDTATIGVVTDTFAPVEALVFEDANIQFVATGTNAKTQVVKNVVKH